MNKFVWLTALSCFSFSLLLAQTQMSQEGVVQQYIPPVQPQMAPPQQQPESQQYYQPQQQQSQQPQASAPVYPAQQYPLINQERVVDQQYIPGEPRPETARQSTPMPARIQPGSSSRQTPALAPPGSAPQKLLEQPIQKPKEPLIYYTEPGILGYQNGRWIGSDHLYNLPRNIGVIVEIVRLPDIKTSLDEAIFEKNTVEMLRKAGFDAYPLTGSPTPPFPYFHVLIITMPIPEGKIAFVSCRLFEQVQLARVQLAEGVYFQAITWEKQTLVQASREDFPPHIYNDVKEITQAFIDRFKHFEELKNRFGQ